MERFYLQDGNGLKQFAVPASQSGQPLGLSYAEHELLRQRKTPYGLLLEADTTVWDKNVQIPASKHLLLSALPHDTRKHAPTNPLLVGEGINHNYRPRRRPSLQNSRQQILGGLDSLLHQNLPLQPSQRLYLQAGSRVPTVLPAASQSQYGPTASASQEAYGPYWPDGTFSPYRPASVRDHRYSLPQDESACLPTLKRPSKLSNFQSYHPHLPPPSQLNNFHSIPPLSSTARPPLPNPVPDPARYAWQGSSLRTEQIAFRDKTFTWANQMYINLLTSIQLSSLRGSCFIGGSNGSNLPIPNQPRMVTKPAIFPTPPQRSESHLQGLGLQHFRSSVEPRSQIGTRNPPSMGHVKQDFQPQIYPLEANEQANKALNQMELLCQEATTPWIDGMLLAGCLAYGLSQYSKALDWFQVILNRDNRHIEAMSNLAATLLALNRRDEALRYWSAAVKLRPSYFEAVEHLIGLLCSMQKVREAIDTIEFMQSSLRISTEPDEDENETKSRTSSIATTASLEYAQYDYDADGAVFPPQSLEQIPGYGSSGYAIPGCENGRMLALIHAKGNMMYSVGNNHGAAAAFEDAILIATGRFRRGIPALIQSVLVACVRHLPNQQDGMARIKRNEPLLLAPEQAELTVRNMFPPVGELPGLAFVNERMAKKAAIATTSNSLLSLAKIYQDGMSVSAQTKGLRQTCTRDILALYYLSLSLQRSPSTANNVGILMASVQHAPHVQLAGSSSLIPPISGVTPGSGIALALAYYNYGLNLDNKHAHLYTNLGSLLKDIGQLSAAVKMYEMAVDCEGNFDIALANLANAVKDQGKIGEAISYYQRAVTVNPDFVEATCGLATALNSVCNWYGRGGIFADDGFRDRIHVDEHGQMHQATRSGGWMNRVVKIVDKQLKEGEIWGLGCLTPDVIDTVCQQLIIHKQDLDERKRNQFYAQVRQALTSWAGAKWEGSRLVRLVERAIRQISWQWYQDLYVRRRQCSVWKYSRPRLPSSLVVPTAPTVLPFHTFTAPLSARSIRQISQRNALRISVSTLNMSWLPSTVYPPPPPPGPCLNVGYVSSDFNNHPLAHLMQSVFGLHDRSKINAICYATSVSDGSSHRQQIEREAPVFHDASTWNVEKLVNQIVRDQVHVLINLNGYTRGARNEVFAARPAPIQMSFMGFAGTLGAEWCDYILTDLVSAPLSTLSDWRRNVDIEDRLRAESLNEDGENWMYAENLIYTKHTFFCVDHKQSAPDVGIGPPPLHDPKQREAAWQAEQDRRWALRKETFRGLGDDVVILGNFNQLYKIDPATFRMYLRILAAVPNAVLWLLKFPELGEQNLMEFARLWAGPEVAARVMFTDVASKGTHITRASLVDLFLDTPECNAHTTAADVVWSGTPILTWGKWDYKMCSRIAGSIMSSALPLGPEGDVVRKVLITRSETQYEEQAIRLAAELKYPKSGTMSGRGVGQLMDFRRLLWEGRWTSPLFDTARWVRDLERAYAASWRSYVDGQGGDIWL